MRELARPDGTVVGYEIQAPARGGATFVFFNALTGDAESWRPVTSALAKRGHGWLLFDYRGQARSPLGSTAEVSVEAIVADAVALLEAVKPERPILVGLSIGGLFAARAHLQGAPADALLLINTLRRESARLAWLNEALCRCARLGGLRLLRDLYLPLLFDETWLARNRKAFLAPEPYSGLGEEAPELRLLQAGAAADWNLPWERLTLPVLVLSGLADRIFYEEEAVRELTARMPQAVRIDVADAGHLLPAERPEAVVDACLALFGRLWEVSA